MRILDLNLLSSECLLVMIDYGCDFAFPVLWGISHVGRSWVSGWRGSDACWIYLWPLVGAAVVVQPLCLKTESS